MLLSDACYLKECRAEKATEKLKIHAKHNILRSEKTLPGFFLKNIKLIHQKLGKLLTLLSLQEEKINLIETYSSKVFDLTLHKEFLKEKKSHMKYLKKSP